MCKASVLSEICGEKGSFREAVTDSPGKGGRIFGGFQASSIVGFRGRVLRGSSQAAVKQPFERGPTTPVR